MYPLVSGIVSLGVCFDYPGKNYHSLLAGTHSIALAYSTANTSDKQYLDAALVLLSADSILSRLSVQLSPLIVDLGSLLCQGWLGLQEKDLFKPVSHQRLCPLTLRYKSHQTAEL